SPQKTRASILIFQSGTSSSKSWLFIRSFGHLLTPADRNVRFKLIASSRRGCGKVGIPRSLRDFQARWESRVLDFSALRLFHRRLPQELRLLGIRTLESANRFLREHYIAEFHTRFQVPAAQRGSSAFVRRSSRDLDLIFALKFERTVNRDNTVKP